MVASRAPLQAICGESGGGKVVGGGWHRSDIIAALQKRGSPITLLSERSGLDRGSLSASLDIPTYTTAHRIIAAALNVTLHELFPDWYGPDNKPLPAPPDKG